MKIKTPSHVYFEGISKDKGLIFYEYLNFIRFKVMRYKAEEGSLEIYIDYRFKMEDIATMVAGLFKIESNFYGFKSIIINYRGTKILVRNCHSRKDIIQKYLKVFSSEEYKNSVKEVFIDTNVVEENENIYRYDYFDSISTYGSLMRFCLEDKNRTTFYVKAYENGNVELDMTIGTNIKSAEIVVQNIFSNCSVLKGVKTVSFNFNEIGYTCDEINCQNIVRNYRRGTDFSYALYKKEQEEYMKTPEYISKRAKELKKALREQRVLDKVNLLYNLSKTEFDIPKDKQKMWNECKRVNSEDGYSNCIIKYAITMTQFMEYLKKVHNRNVLQSFDIASYYADKIYGVTGYMHGAAVNIISNIWKHGEEVRKYHNKTFGYDGDGVVNPAILTIAA